MLHLRAAVVVLALTSSCASSPTRPAAAPVVAPDARALPPREKLPLAAREMLTLRMDRHGDRMNILMESVVLLNYEVAQVLAEELAAEPKLGRPSEGEKGTLSALLPPAFFDHQDKLVERARELAVAASERADDKIVAAFAGLAGTCVSCHASYLYEDEDLPVDHEPWLHAPEGGGGGLKRGPTKPRNLDREPGKPRSASLQSD